ncbi:MAG: hypothetical protein WC379_17120, partial [Methanoregula sp.]
YKKKDPGNRDSFVLLSNFLNSSCIQSSPHAADPQKPETVPVSEKKFVRTLRNVNRKNFQNLFLQCVLNGKLLPEAFDLCKIFLAPCPRTAGFPAGIPTDDIHRSPLQKSPYITVQIRASTGTCHG